MDEKVRKFMYVVRAGSFTEAARQLRVSQPALTMAIRELERELGAELLVRGGRSFTLSSAGEILSVYAEARADDWSALRAQINDMTNEGAPLSLGMIDSLAETAFADKQLREYMLQSVKNTMVVDNSRRLLAMVADGSVDAAFVVDQGSYPRQLEIHELGHELMSVVVSPKLVKSYTLKQSVPYVSYDETSSTAYWVDKALRRAAVSSSKVFYSTSPQIMLDLCRYGAGFTVLPERMVRKHLERRELIRYPASKQIVIHRPVVHISRQGTYKSRAVEFVAERVRQLLPA